MQYQVGPNEVQRYCTSYPFKRETTFAYNKETLGKLGLTIYGAFYKSSTATKFIALFIRSLDKESIRD
jgi:hypothetical protein